MKRPFIYIISLILLYPFASFSEVVKLKNGDSLNVVINRQTEDSLIVDHSSLGQLIIDKVNIANLQQLKLKSIKAEMLAIPEQQTVDTGLFGIGLFKNWQRSIDAGLNGATGSSDNAKFRAGFNIRYEDEEHRWDFKSVFLYSQEDHETSENRFKADLLKDWFIADSKWFYFAHAGFDWDEFKDWDRRYRLSIGRGYQVVKTDDLEFAARFGLSGIYEVRDPHDEQRLEGLLGFDFLWEVNELQTLKFSNIFYPAITDVGEYRNVTSLEWTHYLGYYRGLAIKLGFHNEYDSIQTDKNDLKYHASLVWGL